MSSRSWFRRLSSKKRLETMNGTSVSSEKERNDRARSPVSSDHSREAEQQLIQVVVTAPSPSEDAAEQVETTSLQLGLSQSESSVAITAPAGTDPNLSSSSPSRATTASTEDIPTSKLHTANDSLSFDPTDISAAPNRLSREVAVGVAGAAGAAAMNVIKSKLSMELGSLWNENQLHTGGDSALDQVLDAADNMSTVQDNAESVIDQVADTNIGKEVGEFAQQALKGLADSIPLFMKALDEVAKLHPFIGVAVLAFKAVYNLGEKYVENDKNVIALHEEMREMMKVLLQLKDVKDARIAAPDGSTIEGRLQGLVNKTADDIKACGNACETYSKSRIIIKIMMSPKWQGRFSALASLFTQRRGEFEQALVMHTAVSIDLVNNKLDELQRLTLESAKRMEKMFEERMTSTQRDALVYLRQKGGIETFQDEEAKLRAVLKEKPGYAAVEGAQQPRTTQRWQSMKDHPDAERADQTDQIDSVFVEWKMSIEISEERNMERFSQRFQVRIDRLEIDMKEDIRNEGNRIIDFMKEGPHVRINDPDVRTIWQDMNWKGNAKARHFILALKDYYHDKLDNRHAGGGLDQDRGDDWTFPYIAMPYVQSILEAFDDDASGFITIKEVNTFTNSRPDGWSLGLWLAYWAIGRTITLKRQAIEIDGLFDRMFGLLRYVLPANVAAVYKFLDVWRPVYAVIAPLLALPWTGWELEDRFSSYVDQENARLEANLKTVSYIIDQVDMVPDIAGAGRVEKSAIALLRLLLLHDFDLVRAATNRVIEDKELSDSSSSVTTLLTAVETRYDELQLTFTQQIMDLDHQFRTFSGGLFRYYHEPDVLWSIGKVRESDFSEYCYEEDLPVAQLPKVLHDEWNEAPPVDYPEYKDDVTSLDGNSSLVPSWSSPVKSLVGTRYLLVYADDTASIPEMFMRAFDLESSSDEAFEATATSYSGRSYKVSGSCVLGKDHSAADVSFTITYDDDPEGPVHYSGQLELETETVSGTCGTDEDVSAHTCHFVMKRNSPNTLGFRPPPLVFQANKPRALWNYALSAVQDQVRRQLWSWSYHRERRTKWKQYWDWSTGNLSEEDAKKYAQNGCGLSFKDLKYYTALLKNDIYNRATSALFLLSCDHCGTNVTHTRVTCLECETDTRYGSIDLCEDPYCLSSTIDSTNRADLNKPHLPNHDVMKLRRIVHWRQYGSVYRTARRALLKSKGKIKGLVVMEAAPAAPAGDMMLVVPPSEKRSSRVSMTAPPDIRCGVCSGPLSLPCWYCADCCEQDVDTFICADCDAKGGVSIDEQHKKDHTLVRCQEPKKDNTASMERKIASLEETILALKDEMRTMGARNSRVETMMMELLSHAGKSALSTS